MTAGKWEERYKKQVDSNNLLSDKLRATRRRGQQMISTLQIAYQEKITEVLTLKLRVQNLEDERIQGSEHTLLVQDDDA